MGTSPSWAATVLVGQGQVSATANTVFTGAALTASSGVTIVTAGSNGTKVEEVTLSGTGTTVSGVLDMFIFNGSNNFRRDSFYIPVVTPSTTVVPFSFTKTYTNLWIPSGSTLVFASQVASQLICVNAFGGSF